MMVRAGDILTNPIKGKERLIIRATGAETNGELLEVEAHYAPGGAYPPLHYHPAQDEHFEVLEGAITVRTTTGERRYCAGEAFDIPRGLAHTMRNPGPAEARVLWQTRPALATADFYATIYGLAHAGKTDQRGLPNPLQLAVLLEAYRRELVLARPPRPVQWLIIRPLAALGRLLGYHSRYPYPAATASPESPA